MSDVPRAVRCSREQGRGGGIMLQDIREYNAATAVKLWGATTLNRRLPGRYGWADLVMWAMFDGHTFPSRQGVKDCMKEGREHGSCYCGMFGPDGIFQRGG